MDADSTQVVFRLTNQDFIDDTVTVDVITTDPKIAARIKRRADLANSIIKSAFVISQYGQPQRKRLFSVKDRKPNRY